MTQWLAHKGQSGLPVFLTGDSTLDDIRKHERDPRKVIAAVALKTAGKIMTAYARQHAPELLAEMEKLNALLESAIELSRPCRLQLK